MAIFTPEQLQTIQQEVVAEAVRDIKAAFKQLLEQGIVLWELAPPQARLRGYEASTYPEDMMWVLEPEYPKLWNAGVAPELRALTMWRQVTTPGPDGTVPMPSDMTPFFWAELLMFPEEGWEFFSKDFRRLLQQAVEA